MIVFFITIKISTLILPEVADACVFNNCTKRSVSIVFFLKMKNFLSNEFISIWIELFSLRILGYVERERSLWKLVKILAFRKSKKKKKKNVQFAVADKIAIPFSL